MTNFFKHIVNLAQDIRSWASITKRKPISTSAAGLYRKLVQVNAALNIIKPEKGRKEAKKRHADGRQKNQHWRMHAGLNYHERRRQ